MTCSTVQDDLFHCAGYTSINHFYFTSERKETRNTRYSKTNFMSNQSKSNLKSTGTVTIGKPEKYLHIINELQPYDGHILYMLTNN